MKDSGNSRFVIGPNASLSASGAWIFMGIMSTVALGIALQFAVRGLWMILPFAGLELAALGCALWVTQRRNRYREVVRFDEDAVVVECGSLGIGAGVRIELPRFWTRCRLEARMHAHEPKRLLLVCSGQRIEVGRCLTDEERETLASRFKELLKPLRPPAVAQTTARRSVPQG